jgi:2-oxoisovalerate dehydrogenase E1 component
MDAQTIETPLLERLYQQMQRVRRFDQRVHELFLEGFVKGTAHSYVGEEAIAVGACAAIEDKDYIVSHHRGHGHCIAKGADLTRMTAELFGRETGYSKGLGGSMHIADIERGILGANGIVGAGIGLGTGAALSAKLRKSGQICVVFFGDGASNEGIFHEALNMASIWKLPVVFVLENNQFGLSTRITDVAAIDRFSRRAASYSMPGETIDGNDVVAVYDSVSRAASRARNGEGPSLIECITWRWGDHSMRANLPAYRGEEEDRVWREERDAIRRAGDRLKERQVTDARLAEIRDAVEKELTAAVETAKLAAEPTVAVFENAVTAPHQDFGLEPGPGHESARELGYGEAIREAIDQEMARDPRVFVMGEDVGKIGGIFAATRGLIEKYGKERLRDTPISEMAIAGAAVGAAITGMRPIAEIQIFDFITHMIDPIVNQAAKFRYMLGGVPKVPVVFRGPQGGGVRLAAQHSQSLEAWFCHVPGLVVMAPSTPYDAKGLLAAAIRDDNPVIFCEHKLLYVQTKGPVPAIEYAIPVGKADIKRPGKDVTVVVTLALVAPALRAAEQLAREGLDVEVIDPRTLRPLDTETIISSVKKTGRLVIAHEGWKKWGFGAEVAAVVQEEAFDYLDAPIARIGMRDVPMPYNDTLERIVIPGQEEIQEAIKAVAYR